MKNKIVIAIIWNLIGAFLLRVLHFYQFQFLLVF